MFVVQLVENLAEPQDAVQTRVAGRLGRVPLFIHDAYES